MDGQSLIVEIKRLLIVAQTGHDVGYVVEGCRFSVSVANLTLGFQCLLTSLQRFLVLTEITLNDADIPQKGRLLPRVTHVSH